MTLSHSQAHLPAPPPMLMRQQAPPPVQQHAWGGDFQAFVEGKGKGREVAQPMSQVSQVQQGFTQGFTQGGMGYTPTYPRFSQPLTHTSFQPHYQPQQQHQPQPQQQQQDPALLEAEFERALAEHQELERSSPAQATQAEVPDTETELQNALAQPHEGPDFEAYVPVPPPYTGPPADRGGTVGSGSR